MNATIQNEAPDAQFASVQQKAARSSFYLAMRLMPAAQREAMFAIYAFCRAVDDIADDGRGTRSERQAALNEWRADLASLYAGTPPTRLGFLVQPVRQFALRLDDFLAVIDGMEMDVREDIVAPEPATLDLYCDRVASAVGRLSVKVFGMNEEQGFALAHDLGRALQLTNILRDLDEDAQLGRLYLPCDALDTAGITSRDPAAVLADPRLDNACRQLAALAHRHYANAQRLMALRPKGRIATPRLMGAVYSQILTEMEHTGWQAPRHRVSLSKLKLAQIVLANGLSR
ncbi:MAG: presqualene diphosphate synthase HpnD [Alphaproteobacteria bacterium]|nr:presqualene diphosphate synthase HpnD [Alphaproteobacteria bacterium]